MLTTLLVLEMLAAPVLVARQAPTELAIDGDLTEWNFGQFSISPELFFGLGTTCVEEGTVTSNDDHSARLSFAFRKGELLVAALVTDDALVIERAGNQWQGDGLELLFAQPDGSLLHLGVNPVGDLHVFSKGAPRSVSRIVASARTESVGWSVEMSIPFEALGLKGSESSLKVNVAMRDVDPGQKPAHRVWSGQHHSAAASLGTLLFDRSAQASSAWPSAKFAAPIIVDQPLTVNGARLMSGQQPIALRILNYQSAKQNWQTFWVDFDRARVSRELELAQRLGANAIRIFVFDAVFGLEVVKPEMLERLRFVVHEAARRGLVSIVSFFPFKKEVRPEWDRAMRLHVEHIVTAFRADPAIAMWELMNEPDHLWAPPADAGVSAAHVERWAKTMYEAVRTADPSHVVTVGLYGHYLAKQPIDPVEQLPFVDVVSVHFYGETPATDDWFKRLTASTSKPVVLQEFGASSLLMTGAEATRFLDAMCNGAAKAKLAGVGVWELFDHPTGSIAHQSPRYSETAENDFGLVSSDGRVKPQAAAFARCLEVPALRIRVEEAK